MKNIIKILAIASIASAFSSCNSDAKMHAQAYQNSKKIQDSQKSDSLIKSEAQAKEKALVQTSYKVMAGSEIKVSGTSTLHDWSMLASSFSSEGNFIVKDGQLQDVSSLSFILPVTNLKSKEDLMESRAYKTLKAEQFKTIIFKLTQATVVPEQKIIKAIGKLTISGVTNEIAIQTAYVLNSDETITCKGTKPIKMSDFKIKAPVFMLGALKTGDGVIIEILLKLKKENLNNAINF